MKFIYRYKALKFGCSFAKEIDRNDIIFDDSVILKCYTCKQYGFNKRCPPNIPNINYQNFIRSSKSCMIIGKRYDFMNILEFKKLRRISSIELLKILLKLEKTAFNNGYFFSTSFSGGSCKLCKKCSKDCRFPDKARIPLEAIGVNIVKTLQNINIKIKFPIKDYFYRIGLLVIK